MPTVAQEPVKLALGGSSLVLVAAAAVCQVVHVKFWRCL